MDRKSKADHLDAQLCRPALARDSVAETLEAPLRVGLVQRVVTCFHFISYIGHQLQFQRTLLVLKSGMRCVLVGSKPGLHRSHRSPSTFSLQRHCPSHSPFNVPARLQGHGEHCWWNGSLTAGPF